MTNVTNSKWEETLWEELAELEPSARFLKAGEWITSLTHGLLPELSKSRRLAIVESVESGIEPARFAELVGSRPTTIVRLLEEGRAMRRAQERAE